MPRLRQTYTIITDRSQISEGDLLIYRGNLWDAIGRYRDRYTEVIELGDMSYYVINEQRILCRAVMKISAHTYIRILLQREEYTRENTTLVGFRTGLFPNA